MKSLVAFRSRYGTTEGCAAALSERLGGESVCFDLARGRPPEIRGFDVVLVGGSIYGGKIQREVSWFCERNQEALLDRPVGLFLCCLYMGARAESQLREAFPSWLVAHAFDCRLFGGALHHARLNLFDRLLVRSVSRDTGDVDRIRADQIEALAEAAKAVGRGP
jgi:menaquinone-dependent protoporphyrinogen oxidase